MEVPLESEGDRLVSALLEEASDGTPARMEEASEDGWNFAG